MEDKYKHFRNFMTNELAIGREDIKAWVLEAVEREVQKILGQINIEKKVASSIADEVRRAVRGTSYNYQISDDVRKLMREAIADEISGRIIFKNEPDHSTATKRMDLE